MSMIELPQIRAEIERELKQRKSFYPDQVIALKMDQASADHQIACAAAWLEDLDRIAAFEAAAAAAWEAFKQDPSDKTVITTMPPAQHKVSWKDRRAALERELRLRRHHYAKRVESLQMTQDQADHRIACLQALADRYDDGFDWIASNGARPRFAVTHPVADDVTQARREWDQHRQAVEARRNPAKQGEMAI